ncbi:OLC1v1032374C1 [Oldenlandia corymbosa var. corymbosa]|uniref:OLC1v1032374C1 n=1 Tax=Oldenlandia corymbosa var. corymbosa TaxID=529605 RepID=A0AAV1CMA4_OLDCO|nr:OLC1v1032374C1 [Oldenlandia corymbosa var. corymbosa]
MQELLDRINKESGNRHVKSRNVLGSGRNENEHVENEEMEEEGSANSYAHRAGHTLYQQAPSFEQEEHVHNVSQSQSGDLPLPPPLPPNSTTSYYPAWRS